MGATNEEQALNLSALSSDAAVIPNPSITFFSPQANGTLSFTPVSGATGLVEITVSVVESGGVLSGGTNQVNRTFTVNVSGPGPALLVERVNTEAIISWTTNSSLNWRLESATNLTAPVLWIPDSATPAVVDGRFTVTNTVGPAPRFYRLRNR
jgi:hypothetical protein